VPLRTGHRSHVAPSLSFAGRLEEFTGTVEISRRDVHISRSRSAKFGAADRALRLRTNAGLRETLAQELGLSFVRRGGDNAQRRIGSRIGLSHEGTS
jgi:hypothetical protein